MSSYADDATLAAPTDITALKKKALEAMALQDDIATRLELVEQDRERLRTMLEDTLPKLMGTAGQTEFTMEGGVTVSCTNRVFASLPNAENKPEAFAAAMKYLDTHGAASLAKRLVTVEFSREKKGVANELLKYLHRKYPKADVEVKVSVHRGTLTSWVKEKLADGKDIPMETLGAFQKMVVTIRRPKVPGANK